MPKSPPLFRKLDASFNKVGKSYQGVYETFLECKMDPALIAYVEAALAADAKLPLATAILCGTAIESEIYMAVQDYRGSVGLISVNLISNEYYSWTNLRKDAKTIGILQRKDIKNTDDIMAFRNFVHLGEKYFKDKLKILTFMKDRKAQEMLDTTEDLIVEIALNYIRCCIKYPGYLYLKNNLYHGRKK
jgi:hypothetical protein